MRGSAVLENTYRFAVALSIILCAGCAEFSAPMGSRRPREATVSVPPVETPARPSGRTWLICAGFPSPSRSGTEEALAEDFLAAVGGEATVRPTEGQVITNGTQKLEWFRHEAQGCAIDLRTLMSGRDPSNRLESVVAYAYTTVESDASGESVLGIGSDDGVRVWLNGRLVHDNPVRRGCKENEDLFPVRYRYGTNHVLLKIEQGNGGWGFAFNSFDAANLHAEAEVDLHHLRMRVTLLGPASVANCRADILSGETRLAIARFVPDDNGMTATAVTQLPLPARGERYEDADVRFNGRHAATLTFPEADRKRAEAFAWTTPIAQPAVFSGNTFPDIAFERPLWVRELIGPYSTKTTFYDAEYNEVTKPGKPGRYGAVVKIHTDNGRAYRRFVTLYKLRSRLDWWRQKFETDIVFPPDLGIERRTVNCYRTSVTRFVSDRMKAAFTESPDGAVLLAGLDEAQKSGEEAEYYNEAHRRDRRWWIELKRRLYGWETKYDRMIARPRPLPTPTRLVREGLPAQAGMKPDFPEKLDAVLTEWAGDTDEPFAVCVVRHGVIAFHRAYGMHGDRPMRVDTKCWMASITKLLSGTLIMMLVDQGLMSLDDPVSNYLPATATNVKPILSIRHLYTHTDDLDEHIGVEYSDMGERIAYFLPLCRPASGYRYNGTGMELACKALEAVGGKTLADFFVEHLLEPLHCTNTDVDSASWSAYSTPLDMARIGQMLLQKGTYGNWRFFSEETFEQMLPRNLEYILGRPTAKEYGIGTTYFRNEGLGEGTFAHGAASAATFRIDPVNDLVVVMTRDRAGKNFNKYHQRFLDTIVEGIARDGGE